MFGHGFSLSFFFIVFISLFCLFGVFFFFCFVFVCLFCGSLFFIVLLLFFFCMEDFDPFYLPGMPLEAS